MSWDKRLRSGFTDFGGIEISPTAQALVLTDREDGSLWLLSFNTTHPIHLSIQSNFATMKHRESVRIFSADEGPTMGEDGQFRLILRGGRLGLEFMPFAVGERARVDSPPYARTVFAQREVNMDSTDLSLVHIEIAE